MDDTDIANYSDGNSPYATADDIDRVLASLENVSNTLYRWFSDNLFKGNADKCHLLVNVKDEVSMKIDDFNIVNSKCEKPLGVKFDHKLTFNCHVSDVCKDASRKINALARVAPYMSISKRHILMNAFLNHSLTTVLWYGYVTVDSRINNVKISRLHERYLRIIYNDETSSFKNLLEKDGSVSIDNRKLKLLAIEVFQINKGILSSIMKGIFEARAEHPHNLRCISQFSAPLVSTVFHGAGSISLLGPKIWSLLPENFENIYSLENFKILIKKWKPENCPCRLCKVYIKYVGFL